MAEEEKKENTINHDSLNKAMALCLIRAIYKDEMISEDVMKIVEKKANKDLAQEPPM